MWLEASLGLAAILVVGRLCLSILPPGWPGEHDRREGGATFAATVMLGSLALELLPSWPIWAVVLVVRLALLPGALRPRHELTLELAKGWQRLSPAAVTVAAAAAIWVSSTDPGALRGAHGLVAPAQAAAIVWLLQALAPRTRRPRWVGALWAVLGALAFGLLSSRWPAQDIAPALLAALWIAIGIVVWRRTADRRAAALAIAAGVSCVLLEPGGVLGA